MFIFNTKNFSRMHIKMRRDNINRQYRLHLTSFTFPHLIKQNEQFFLKNDMRKTKKREAKKLNKFA